MATIATTATTAQRWNEAEALVAPRSFFDEARSRFLRNKTGLIALAVLMLLILSAVFAPLITKENPLVGAASQRL